MKKHETARDAELRTLLASNHSRTPSLNKIYSEILKIRSTIIRFKILRQPSQEQIPLVAAQSRTSSAPEEQARPQDEFAEKKISLNLFDAIRSSFKDILSENAIIEFGVHWESQLLNTDKSNNKLEMIRKLNIRLLKVVLMRPNTDNYFTVLLKRLIRGEKKLDLIKEETGKINRFEGASAASSSGATSTELGEEAQQKIKDISERREVLKLLEKSDYLTQAGIEYNRLQTSSNIGTSRRTSSISNINPIQSEFDEAIRNLEEARRKLVRSKASVVALPASASASASAPIPIAPALVPIDEEKAVLLALKKLLPIPEEESKQTREYNLDYDGGDPDISVFTVHVYKNTGHGDVLLGSRTVRTTDTIKSVIDSVKGANPNQRCIVTCYKNFLNSLGPKDYYVPFGNLRLKYDQVELWLI